MSNSQADSQSSAQNNSANAEPNKTTGQFHSVKGTAVEAIGNLTGATSWQQSGKEEHAAGEGEYNAAQATEFGEGLRDKISGRAVHAVGAMTGDEAQEAKGRDREQKATEKLSQ